MGNQINSSVIRSEKLMGNLKLNFSYKLCDKITALMGPPKRDEPVMAFPTPVGTSVSYPPSVGFPPPRATGPYPPHNGPYPPHNGPHQGF
ncbi:hypothetical protein BVC80_881g24 [Macleaya cordata]|uniref:Uncharacterized protein n=1 Tax=Macleaya cordata TaxID=56857 RepID=A0A200RD79_MACCD|nr:hypothetical protein BVC80_881g24 [Macleaya cordata]